MWRGCRRWTAMADARLLLALALGLLGGALGDVKTDPERLKRDSVSDAAQLILSALQGGARPGGHGHTVSSFHGSSISSVTSPSGETLVAHEELSDRSGSVPHRTSGTFVIDRKGGISGFSCVDNKCKEEKSRHARDRRKRSAVEPMHVLVGADLLHNVLDTLQTLGQRLQLLQERLAQSLQEAASGFPHGPVYPQGGGLPPVSQFSGAAAGGAVLTSGPNSQVDGEFHSSTISSSSSPSGDTVVSHKEISNRVGAPTHTSSGTYHISPQGEVSGVSCKDGKCEEYGKKETVTLEDRTPAQQAAVSPSQTHFTSSSYVVGPSGEVSGVSCVDNKCTSTKEG